MAATCPFCNAAARAGCNHLALAAPATEFIARCVEHCHAGPLWQQILKTDIYDRWSGAGDFSWSEFAFCHRFLKLLRWFGAMEHQWRDDGRAHGREQFALLWSKDPRRLWWELRDYLEQAAEEAECRHKQASKVCCPICGADNLEDECKHLAFHGDDLRTKEVVEICGRAGAWQKLNARAPGLLPEFASQFFAKFTRQFPPVDEVRSATWTGAPGLSGVYTYVWAQNPGRLRWKVRHLLERRLASAKAGGGHGNVPG